MDGRSIAEHGVYEPSWVRPRDYHLDANYIVADLNCRCDSYRFNSFDVDRVISQSIPVIRILVPQASNRGHRRRNRPATIILRIGPLPLTIMSQPPQTKAADAGMEKLFSRLPGLIDQARKGTMAQQAIAQVSTPSS